MGQQKEAIKTDQAEQIDQAATIGDAYPSLAEMRDSLKKQKKVMAEEPQVLDVAETEKIAPEESEDSNKEFKEKMDSAFINIFAEAKKREGLGIVVVDEKKQEKTDEKKEKTFNQFLDKLKKEYIKDALSDVSLKAGLKEQTLEGDILKYVSSRVEEEFSVIQKDFEAEEEKDGATQDNLDAIGERGVFLDEMREFCHESLGKLKEDIKGKADQSELGAAKEKRRKEKSADKEKTTDPESTPLKKENSIGDKIILSKKEFSNRYGKLVGKSFYNKDNDLLKIINFDEKNSLVEILIQSRPRKVRVNELESIYLMEYELQKTKRVKKPTKETVVKKVREEKALDREVLMETENVKEKEELEDMIDFTGSFIEEFYEKANWDDYDNEDKANSINIELKAFLRRLIKRSTYFGDLEKEKIEDFREYIMKTKKIEGIVEKIISDFKKE